MNRSSIQNERTFALIAAAAFSLLFLVIWFNWPGNVYTPPALPPAKSEPAGRHAAGRIIPRDLPNPILRLDDGSEVQTTELLAGRWTLLQLIFTGCSTTCPIQGAIFARTQTSLKAAGVDAQLLSLSIDPLGDDSAALRRWLDSMGAEPGWRAAVPKLEDLAQLLDVMGGRGTGVDVHDARVYLVEPNGKLIYITEEMPEPSSLVTLLKDAKAYADKTN